MKKRCLGLNYKKLKGKMRPIRHTGSLYEYIQMVLSDDYIINHIFTYPLTLEIKADKSVSVTQNGATVEYASKDGIAYISVSPNLKASIKLL